MYLVDIDLETLKKQAGETTFFCFGGGKLLKDLLRVCPIEKSIEGIIDNDAMKWGTSFPIRGISIPIMSLEQAMTQGASEKRLLLTVSYLGGIDIIEQLRNCMMLQETTIHWVLFLIKDIRCANQQNIPQNFRRKSVQMIPKIIHYCWFGKNPIPLKQRHYIAGWKCMCPDYEIICWSESNYNIQKSTYAYQAYQSGAWAFVSDYVRKDVLYKYGGIYLDTDVEVVRPLDELLYQEGFCGFDDNKINSGLGMGAVPGLSVVGEMRDDYRGYEFSLHSRRHMIIGPDYETALLIKHGLRTDESYQVVADMSVYPPGILSSAMIYSDEWTKEEHTYTVHHFAGSWVDSVTKKKWEKMRDLYASMKKYKKILL